MQFCISDRDTKIYLRTRVLPAIYDKFSWKMKLKLQALLDKPRIITVFLLQLRL